MKKLLTAMSGGVDSAVCCALLQQAGFEVGGGTMLLRPGGEAEAEDARSVCEQLGVPFHLFPGRMPSAAPSRMISAASTARAGRRIPACCATKP